MKAAAVLFGMLFGALLAGSRVTDFNVIHEGLLMHSAYIYLFMGSSMLVSLVVLWILEKRGWKTPIGGLLKLRRNPIQRRHVLGGVIFGLGWAVTGTCPAVSAAQLGTGILGGLVVMVGLLIGTIVRDWSTRTK